MTQRVSLKEKQTKSLISYTLLVLDEISDSRALIDGLISFGLPELGKWKANSWWKGLTKGEKISLSHQVNKIGKTLGIDRLYRGISRNLMRTRKEMGG